MFGKMYLINKLGESQLIFTSVGLQVAQVVSIGCFPAFYVVFFPMEYIPSKHPLSTYVKVFPL